MLKSMNNGIPEEVIQTQVQNHSQFSRTLDSGKRDGVISK